MIDVTVYYCWACDAHRKAAADRDGKLRCPHCQRELTADAKLPIRGSTLHISQFQPVRKSAWPAPIRPRLAAS
jgi:hypothetical protein